MSTDDQTEREVLVSASMETVWDLVSVPGWWIGDGDADHRRVERETDRTIVDFPPHGRFPVIVEAQEPMAYIRFRCGDSADNEELNEINSTCVEFFLNQTEYGINLKVRESGFVAYIPDPKDRGSAIENNTRGWGTQLGWAKQQAEDV